MRSELLNNVKRMGNNDKKISTIECFSTLMRSHAKFLFALCEVIQLKEYNSFICANQSVKYMIIMYKL